MKRILNLLLALLVIALPLSAGDVFIDGNEYSDVDVIQLNGLTTEPSTAPLGNARVYYSSIDDKVYLSKNGNSYSEIGSAGGITAVGDVANGDAFTGSQGNTLHFEGTTSDDYEIALTGADATADRTITLPDATGTLLLKEQIDTEAEFESLLFSVFTNNDTIDISDNTNLTAGTNITLSNDTLNVDDVFLLNTGDTATGDYAFDSGTLFIDSSNDRVGIGTTEPDTKLHIKGTTGDDIIRTDIGLDINPVVKPSAPTLTLLEEAGNVDAGLHYYRITYYTDLGETGVSNYSSVTTDATHGKIKITLSVSDDYRVIGRRIYRSKADGPAYKVYLVADISDNTTTEYIDNIADADLGSTNAYFRENTTAKYITINGEGVWMAGKGAEPNTIFGTGAGATIFAGTAESGSNVLIGGSAGKDLTTGNKNVAVGYSALRHLTSGGSNTSVGAENSQYLTTGQNNVTIGRGAGRYNQTGSYNVLIGNYAGYSFSGNSYSYNTLIGCNSMQHITTGQYNVSLGYWAGRYIADGSTENKTSSYSLYLGAKTKALADGDTNEIVIGYDTTGFGSNTAAYGNSSITKHIFQAGSVGIGTTSPSYKLDVDGTINGTAVKVNGTDVLTSESDPLFSAMDTETELESQLTDVTNVYTNNDGSLSDDDLSDNTTDDLSEGTNNLYFTDERVDDRVANLIQNGTGITWTYNDANNTLTGNVSSTFIQDADGDTLLDTEESADKDEIVGKVAGVEALRIYSSGILDLPKQSGCAGYLGTAQSINNASATKVMFDTKEYDLQNEYDNVTNYRFTATKDGKYLITCKITFSDALNTTDRIFVSIYKNGSEYKNSDVGGSNGTYQGPIISTVVHLVAGDYIEFYVYQATGASKSLCNSPSYTYFSITKVQ